MAQATDSLTGLIEPAITALGYELVGVEQVPQGRHSVVRIYIDAEQGISLADCERVSHQVSGILDVEDPIRGQYSLEVSSPGLDRPLFTLAHYARYIGQPVKLRLRVPQAGRRKLSGVIRAVNGEVITLQEQDANVIELHLNDIDKANLVPDYSADAGKHQAG
jgi:ribosome maturation factor RimP